MVLPRPLRRMVRFLGSLASGRVNIPRHVGSASVVAFYAATSAYIFALVGEPVQVTQALTSAAGFAINNVKVSGNAETSEIDILEKIGLDGTTSLMALDVAATRDALKTLPWIREAEVRKVYPDTIEIKLKEKTAFGIWQYGKELSLIERDGKPIAPLRDNKFAHLPLFVGKDAGTGAAEIMRDLERWPEVKSRVKALMRVAGRRWDIQLGNGVVIKLPEHDMDRAMAELADFDRSQQVLERDIVAIDLRLADRTTVQLTADAAERRKKAVEARAKELKKHKEAI
ncbi:MAG: cell division protein FtsQ/DivIB [Rhizobiaceae bacterium]|nr:cell division protein FtsQ/DivIB [Rhizobiaceae bacterium]